MNILEILMNTQFTPLDEFDYATYAGASEHAKIGEYKDMVIVIDGSALDPSSIEVFDESGECISSIEVFDESGECLSSIEVFDESGKCIYIGYLSKDGRNMHEYDASGRKRS